MSGAPAIARLRARLAAQVGAPLTVSTDPVQHVFDYHTSAYAEIEVRRGAGFAVVVVIGSLPSEDFIVDLWHRFAPEVWLVDTQDEQIHIARAGEPVRRLDRTGTLHSAELPGVAIPVDALFAPPS